MPQCPRLFGTPILPIMPSYLAGPNRSEPGKLPGGGDYLFPAYKKLMINAPAIGAGRGSVDLGRWDHLVEGSSRRGGLWRRESPGMDSAITGGLDLVVVGLDASGGDPDAVGWTSFGAN